MGCVVSSLVFAFFFGVGLFALAGGIYLAYQGFVNFGEGFWYIFEMVAGVTVSISAPIILVRVFAKYRQSKVGKEEIDKPA